MLEEKKKKKDKEKRIAPILKEIIRMGAFLVLLTPLVISDKFFFPFVSPKSLYFMALVEIIFACWFILAIFCPKYRPKSNLLLWAITLFFWFITFSSIFGMDFSHSFWSKYERMTGLLMLFHLLAFFLVLTCAFKKKKDWFLIFAVSVGIASVISIISFRPDIVAMFKLARQGVALGNSSFLGSYLLFNAFLALLLIVKSKKLWKIVPGLALGIIAAAICFSNAQAVTLSFFGGLFLLFLFYLIFANKKLFLRNTGLILLLVTILGSGLVVYFAFQYESSIHNWLVQHNLFKQPRVVVWEIGWKAWQERPWLGWGLENYNLAFDKYYNPCLPLKECGGEVWFDRAHNIVIDTGVNSGFLGLLSYLTIFGVSFYLLSKKYLKNKEFWVPAIIIVLLIAYFIQNLTVFDMVSSYMMFFLVLAFIGFYTDEKKSAFQLTAEESESQQVAKKRLSFYPAKIILAIIIITAMGFAFFKFTLQPLKANKLVIKAVSFSNSADRVFLYKKTLEISPTSKYQIRNFFAKRTLNIIEGKTKDETIEGLETEVQFIIQELEKSMKECPLDLRSSLTLTKAHSLYAFFYNQDFSRAAERAGKTIELSPSNQEAYWALAQIKIYQGNFEEAVRLAEKAIEVEPNFSRAHLVIIKMALLMKDHDLAREKAEEAIKLFPGLKKEIEKMTER
jgi:O-antigen ligase